MLKVGDYVKGNCFDGIRQIEKIDCGLSMIKGIKLMAFAACNLTLVCGFTKGQFIEVSDDDEEWYACKFYSYDSELECPFIAENGEGAVNSFKYARAIKPKYKAYSKPKLEWIDKYVKADWFDEDETVQVIGICKGTDDKWLVEFNDGENTNFKYFFECYKWADGSPCGEEVE